MTAEAAASRLPFAWSGVRACTRRRRRRAAPARAPHAAPVTTSRCSVCRRPLARRSRSVERLVAAPLSADELLRRSAGDGRCTGECDPSRPRLPAGRFRLPDADLAALQATSAGRGPPGRRADRSADGPRRATAPAPSSADARRGAGDWLQAMAGRRADRRRPAGGRHPRRGRRRRRGRLDRPGARRGAGAWCARRRPRTPDRLVSLDLDGDAQRGARRRRPRTPPCACREEPRAGGPRRPVPRVRGCDGPPGSPSARASDAGPGRHRPDHRRHRRARRARRPAPGRRSTASGTCCWSAGAAPTPPGAAELRGRARPSSGADGRARRLRRRRPRRARRAARRRSPPSTR